VHVCFSPSAKQAIHAAFAFGTTGNTRLTIFPCRSAYRPAESGQWNFLLPDNLARNRKIQRAQLHPSYILPHSFGYRRRVWLRQEYEFSFFYIF